MLLVPSSATSLVSNAVGEAWVKAIQKQIDGDFAPIWNIGDTLVYIGDSQTEKPKPGDRVVRLVPTSSEPGTLGSHWLDGSVPTGEVGVQTCIDDGVEVSSCLSHEILEMLLDPYATLAFQVGRFFLAAEVCDRVEDSSKDYKIDGVTVENFSLPSAFNGGSFPFDFRHRLTTNTLTPNGYQLQVDIGSGQWSQITGKLARRSKHVADTNSRRAMRMRRAGADPRSLVIV
jgi:hypothetical protein